MIDELIVKLQAASGPDRELDAAMGELFIAGEQYKSIYKRPNGTFCIRYYPGLRWMPPGPEYLRLPHFTESIDDALKLSPAGWTRSVDATLPEAGITVQFYKLGALNRNAISDHSSEPIATCIAALKARKY